MKIAYALPRRVVTNDDLVREFPEWTADKIAAKTGIRARHVAGEDETALDLAAAAAERLFVRERIDPASVGGLVLCTQTRDVPLPSPACLLQRRLGLPTACAALAIDHGCSGFVYALSLAKGLLATGVARRVLVVTAETYTKYLAPDDKSTRAVFGDGAAATLLDADDLPGIGAFVFGTDGRGAEHLTVRDGRLFMDGPEIFDFTLEIVPRTLDEVLAANDMTREDVDLYVFHQANAFMLETIREVTGLPRDRFYVNLETTGNTVSSSIPIALAQLRESGRLTDGMRVVLMGFGVGLSWAAVVVRT